MLHSTWPLSWFGHAPPKRTAMWKTHGWIVGESMPLLTSHSTVWRCLREKLFSSLPLDDVISWIVINIVIIDIIPRPFIWPCRKRIRCWRSPTSWAENTGRILNQGNLGSKPVGGLLQVVEAVVQAVNLSLASKIVVVVVAEVNASNQFYRGLCLKARN